MLRCTSSLRALPGSGLAFVRVGVRCRPEEIASSTRCCHEQSHGSSIRSPPHGVGFDLAESGGSPDGPGASVAREPRRRDSALHEGRIQTPADVDAAVVEGAAARVRPLIMTVATTVPGLLPLLWETGVGADVSARTAAPVVGGLWSCMFLTLLVLPAARPSSADSTRSIEKVAVVELS